MIFRHLDKKVIIQSKYNHTWYRILKIIYVTLGLHTQYVYCVQKEYTLQMHVPKKIVIIVIIIITIFTYLKFKDKALCKTGQHEQPLENIVKSIQPCTAHVSKHQEKQW